jgi:formylglycine-generating enzyme required for sulfatase activity
MKIILIILFTLSTFVFTQTAEITNITANQRTDGTGIVDICYDLQGDVNFSIFSITAEISFDQGSTWNNITNATGDYGNNIEQGIGKCFVWNFSAEFGELYTPDSHLRIHADSAPLPPAPGVFTMVTIPSGDYTYGENDQTQTIGSDFEIMKYQVTNAEYLVYLEEALANGDITVNGNSVQGYYEGDEYTGSGTQTFYALGSPSNYNYARISYNGVNFIINEPDGFTVGEYDTHPVVYVTWYGANAFALHYGMRLPTEYEWEKTARGNTGNNYPWGNSITGANANYNGSGDPWELGTTPIGYYDGINAGTTNSPSPYGAYDMAGNVWEWTDSWYNSSNRVLRGGGWSNYTSLLQSWYRGTDDPSPASGGYGFRCSRTL